MCRTKRTRAGCNVKERLWPPREARNRGSARGTIGGRLSGDNKTLAASAAGVLSANIALILSGHHHIFQVLNCDGDLPVQIVWGDGGDLLNPGPSSDPAG